MNNIKKLAFGKYEVEKNGNTAIIEFSRKGRYDTFDGKYHPAWLFCYNGQTVICVDKSHAMSVAEKML